MKGAGPTQTNIQILPRAPKGVGGTAGGSARAAKDEHVRQNRHQNTEAVQGLHPPTLQALQAAQPREADPGRYHADRQVSGGGQVREGK